MQRRTAGATAWSVVLHAGLLAALLLIRLHAGDSPAGASIINGEIVNVAFTWSSSTNAALQTNGTTEALTAPEPERPDATEPNELAADAVVAEPNEPAPAELADEPAAAVADAESAPSPAATPAEADVPEASAEVVAATGPAVAAAPNPEASSPADPAFEEPPPGASDAADAVAATQVATEAPPGVPIQGRERQMIAKRFASWNGRFAAGEGNPSVDWKQDGQAYTAVFRAPSKADATGLEHIVVDVTTEQGGKKMSTQLTMTRLAFSNFAQFVDKWDPNVQIHDDVIDGRFHSNTEISVATSGATPVFGGKVTLASRDIATAPMGMIGTRMPINKRRVFPEGLETGVRRIMLPSRLLPLLNEAASGDDAVQRFEHDARITFYSDGTYGWSYVENGGPEERRQVIGPAHYLIGLEGTTLRISGTVNGKVLVYSARDIVIEDDLRYADVRGSVEADDYLGLVAEIDVAVAEPEVTGSGDLYVEASIYARRRFAIREFRSRPSGTLMIYGSVAAGSITATEPRFATKIEFDRRLANARPPSFPLTDRYELESWNGEWRAEDAVTEALADDALSDEAGAGDGTN